MARHVAGLVACLLAVLVLGACAGSLPHATGHSGYVLAVTTSERPGPFPALGPGDGGEVLLVSSDGKLDAESTGLLDVAHPAFADGLLYVPGAEEDLVLTEDKTIRHEHGQDGTHHFAHMSKDTYVSLFNYGFVGGSYEYRVQVGSQESAKEYVIDGEVMLAVACGAKVFAAVTDPGSATRGQGKFELWEVGVGRGPKRRATAAEPLAAHFDAVACRDGVIHALTYKDFRGLNNSANNQEMVLLRWDTRNPSSVEQVDARYADGRRVLSSNVGDRDAVVRGEYLWWRGPTRVNRTNLTTGVTETMFALPDAASYSVKNVVFQGDHVFTLDEESGTLTRQSLAESPRPVEFDFPAIPNRLDDTGYSITGLVVMDPTLGG